MIVFGFDTYIPSVTSSLSKRVSSPSIQKVSNYDSSNLSGSVSDISSTTSSELIAYFQRLLIASWDCLIRLFGFGIIILLNWDKKKEY